MPDNSGHREIIEVIQKAIITLIVVNFTIGIFYAFTSTNLNVNNPQSTGLQQLSGLEATINSSSSALTSSFSLSVLTQNSSCLFSGCPLNNVGNLAYDIGLFIISLLTLMTTSILVVIVLVLEVIPQLFIGGQFGVFNYIAVTIYGFLVFFISVYSLYLINQAYRSWVR